MKKQGDMTMRWKRLAGAGGALAPKPALASGGMEAAARPRLDVPPPSPA